MSSTNLTDPPTQVLGGDQDATPPENVFLDTNLAPMKIYRIEIE